MGLFLIVAVSLQCWGGPDGVRQIQEAWNEGNRQRAFELAGTARTITWNELAILPLVNPAAWGERHCQRLLINLLLKTKGDMPRELPTAIKHLLINLVTYNAISGSTYKALSDIFGPELWITLLQANRGQGVALDLVLQNAVESRKTNSAAFELLGAMIADPLQERSTVEEVLAQIRTYIAVGFPQLQRVINIYEGAILEQNFQLTREQFPAVRTEVAALREEVGALRNDTRRELAAIRTQIEEQFAVVIGLLRQQPQAPGVATTSSCSS
ncbi:MAG: hypothetical protein B7X10_05400 [Burkholderiales bacterium 21-58-4]|nr:MAG: hypothetical protein B7X10_05400 [Burkholderiales bacterium 21-58-4]